MTLTLYVDSGTGYIPLAEDTITIIPGSDSSSGYDEGRFIVPENYSVAGGTTFKAVMSGNGVETEHSELKFTVVVNEVGLDSPVRLNYCRESK